jgi:hypothetical protein
MYKVTGKIGLFWDGPTVDLGCWRWEWFAKFRARVWLQNWPHSVAWISKGD